MMNGEMERIWLATANGELRSEVLALKRELACWDVVFEMVPKRDSDLGRLKYAVVADEITRLQSRGMQEAYFEGREAVVVHLDKKVERLLVAGDRLAIAGALYKTGIPKYLLDEWEEARRG